MQLTVYIQRSTCACLSQSELLTLIFAESVRNMVSLSMPRPHPPVGGRPYSSAVQKFSSITYRAGIHRE